MKQILRKLFPFISSEPIQEFAKFLANSRNNIENQQIIEEKEINNLHNKMKVLINHKLNEKKGTELEEIKSMKLISS